MDGETSVEVRRRCAGLPAGEEDGHRLHNRSDAPCVFVTISAGSREADSGEYPDIDMVFDADGYARKDDTCFW